MLVCFYLIFLFAYLILGFMARAEPVLSSEHLSFAERPFEKMATLIFRFAGKRNRLIRLIHRFRPGEVKADLRTLDPSRNYERSEKCYFIRKIRYVLLFGFLADILAIALFISGRNSSVIQENATLLRPEYGEESSETELVASENGNEIGTFVISVGARQYTAEETDDMAEEVFAILEKKLKGANTSLDRVETNLTMPSSVEGYPFRISWNTSRYGLVDTSGKVNTEELGEGENETVSLCATLSYEGRKYEKSFDVTVVPVTLSEEEQLRTDIYSAAAEQNGTATEETFYSLPTIVDGKTISWSEPEKDYSLPVFGIVLTVGLAYYRLADRELHSKIEKRKQQLTMDYPQILSRLVLLVGAGMSVRSGFEKMAEDYKRKRENTGETRFVYEEILLMCREFGSGVAEIDALSHFGQRCGLLSYSRFCSLLSQNLRKGNSELLNALRGEAAGAFEERKNLARQLGEEAGTKLLFPMILMLVVTMIIIMIPAYSSFSL